DVASLRVDAGHDVFDGAIFAGGIHGLKNQEQRPAVLRVKFFLVFRQQFFAVLQSFLGVFLAFQAVGVFLVVVLATNILPLANAIGTGNILRFPSEFLALHADKFSTPQAHIAGNVLLQSLR